ncbi:MAG: hypothetical protein D6734_03135 [Candidatus Schekmanbacteria bacterium]|nr:MAG: hypothetical protein D6734_03135 [Candidatus Schekmanbacteria bacterium]
MNKSFIRVLNIFIILLLLTAVAVYFTGGWKFSISSLHFNIKSIARILNIALILLLLKTLFQKDSYKIEAFLEKILCRENEKNKETFTFGSSLIFLVAGIILGICDGLFEPLKSVKYIFTPLTPSGLERLTTIGKMLLFYSAGFFALGIIISFIIYFLKNLQNKLTFTLAAAFTLSFIILSRSITAFSLIKPEPYGPVAIIDCIVFAILSITIFYIIPKQIFSRKFLNLSYPIIGLIVISLFYLIPHFIAQSRYQKEAKEPHSRVILITIDTTRADHLGLYDYERNTTPNLEKLAKKGTLFLRAYSQMTTTDPSHTTILSGAYPRTHGLLKNGMKLGKKDLDFLQSWFKKQGYTTAAITSRAFLDPDYMELPPFDYKSVPNHKFKTKRGKKYKYDIATGTYNRAKLWIEHNLDKDIFLWVHFWDPHGSYDPPAPYNSMFNNGYKGRYRYPKEIFPGFPINKNEYYSKEEADYLTSLYDGEIAFADKYVAKLIEYISKKTPQNSEAPLFVITSDHGETLGEIQDKRGYCFDHGKIITYSQMHVPLLFIWEGKIPQNEKIDGIVGLVDVAPTIADLVNSKNKFSADGISLKNLLLKKDGFNLERNAIVSQRRLIDKETPPQYRFLNAREYAVVKDRWLLRVNEIRGNELYDIIKDPLEQIDLIKDNKTVEDELLKVLDQWKKEFPETKISGNIITGDRAKLLKSLGYIQ